MQVKRLIIDVSSICWVALFMGEDKEFGYTVMHEGKEVKIASAAFGLDNAIEHLTYVMEKFGLVPSDLIFVVEGENSKTLRKYIYPEYKNGADRRVPESYVEFGKMRDKLISTYLDLGASSVTQSGLEADDVIGYLCETLEGTKIVHTNDGDLCVLVDLERDSHVFRRDEYDQNPYGPFPHKYITLYKALVGDMRSDNYPGAKGFGDNAFLNLYALFDDAGLDSLIDLIKNKDLDKLQEDVGELKALQKIIDNKEMVYTCWELARLHTNKVNTMRVPLVWSVGMVKPVTQETDSRLKQWAGMSRLVHKDNYAKALDFLKSKMPETRQVALDIETSTSEESDDWLMKVKGKSEDSDDLGVDVVDSKLTGLGLTFGCNNQYTFYFTVDHVETAEVKNLTSMQVLIAVDSVPHEIPHVIQNVSFELPILYKEWHEEWDTGEWMGFIPNAYDTRIEAAYVNENLSKGLKQRSEMTLGYKQITYAEVTTKSGFPEDLPKGGRVINVAEDEVVTKSYKMNELTAAEVLAYGADDTICTIALHNHYRVIMEIEKTWEVYKEVEIKPAYVTALAFVQGCKISIEELKRIEREDDLIFNTGKEKLDKFLIEKGWEGTICPSYTEITPAIIKEANLIITGEELKTQVRTLSKFVPILEEAGSHLLAKIVEDNNVRELNKLVASRFSGEPEVNFGSPKQVQKLLYSVIGLPVRIVNKLTPNERENNPVLARAHQKHNKIKRGSVGIELTEEDLEALKGKASTDDTAIQFAVAFDATEEQKEILNAITSVKSVTTRRGLYYRPYPNLAHFSDGKLHSSMNQSAAATLRYTSSGPNLQQLAKRGEGVKVRGIIVPHKPKSVICSIDFVGQELRLMAAQSRDVNMLACYIGDNLKDIHSLTACGAMTKKWGKDEVQKLAESLEMNAETTEELYNLFMLLRKSDDKVISKKSDDLRKDGKNVNFAAQFDAQAARVGEMLVMSTEDAQTFLDAKYAMFPRVETWKDEVRSQLMQEGYVTTMMGARRHLAHVLSGSNKWDVERAGRQGPNFKIQGSAAEQTKLALAGIWDSKIQFKLDMVFIAPVHDEVVWSVTAEDAVESIRSVHKAMTRNYSTMDVPILGSISVGPSFGVQYECGEDFNEENILKAIDKSLSQKELKTA
jgi:DNA polymerase I-like protein with 3'-5' exonuclease and polymerase domains/5'-3' exonuclease